MLASGSSEPPLPVTLDNWQSAEQVGWTFQHMDEIFPSAVISRGEGPAAELAVNPEPVASVPVTPLGGTEQTLADVMAATNTDGWLVARPGEVLAESYSGEMGPDTRHLLMSVSKSIVGLAVGALVERGLVDPQAQLTSYIPELAGSGYAGATVRNLLDMRSGIAFSEEYLNPQAEVRLLEQAFGWATRVSPDVPTTLRGFLQSLRQKSPHGGAFEYRSCESDVLGWLCEAVTGRAFPELVSELVWARIGARYDASIGIDSEGSGMFDGGISATLGDLARLGLTILGDGLSPSGQQVVPASWIDESFAGAPDSREAFAASSDDLWMPGGMYRNQFWFPYPDRPVLLCLGIHGQMIYVNRSAGLVGVKLSSWPTPQDAWKLFSTVRAFDAVSQVYGR